MPRTTDLAAAGSPWLIALRHQAQCIQCSARAGPAGPGEPELRGSRASKAISAHDSVGVVQLVFDAVAGAAALVALIIAYRRHKAAESIAALHRANAQLEHTRLYNQPFTAAAAQIGDEKAAIQLAGVRAMAGLADDWPEHRQACVDVLCAYLRRPNPPDPGQGAPPEGQARVDSAREVRDTVTRIIIAHLRPVAEVSWQSLNLDFTGVAFDGADFSGAGFAGGKVSFGGARFSSGQVSFADAEFSGSQVSFAGAEFSGGQVSFAGAEFSGGQVKIGRAHV